MVAFDFLRTFTCGDTDAASSESFARSPEWSLLAIRFLIFLDAYHIALGVVVVSVAAFSVTIVYMRRKNR